jgi:hypothetical protein
VTVSLTFDDTYQEQREAAAILEAHGLRGTFYVNSPRLHRSSARPSENVYLSIADALGLQERGHDVGGHTLTHASLTDVPESERVREILGDRAQLTRLGLQARSFAYPYGHVESDPDRSLGRRVLDIARGSGYTSARDTNGFSLEGCDPGPESLPPTDPFLLRSVRSVNEPPDGAERLVPPDTAATLLGWLDHAADCGGGWLPLVFHHLRDDCSAPDGPAGYCFDFAELDRLGASLASGMRCPGADAGRCYRIRVASVTAAIAGSESGGSESGGSESGGSELASAPEVPGVGNPSLERTFDSGETECIQRTGASATAVFSRSTLARTGAASERLAIAAPFQAAAELGISRDYGECASFVSAGRAYDLSLFYRAAPEAAAPRLRIATYRLTSDYTWLPWATGAAFSAQSPGSWVRVSFTTAAVPEGTIAVSFGLRQESAGTINVDDFDAAAAD